MIKSQFPKDEDIKPLIMEYQNGTISLEEVVEALGPSIYNYPISVYELNDEACGEFFLYFHERLDKVLKSYSLSEVKFKSWFIVVLSRHFINWKKMQKKLIKRRREYLLLPDFDLDDLDNLEINSSMVYDPEADWEIKYEKARQQKWWESILNDLPKKTRVVIKLCYFEFFNAEDIQHAGRYFNLSVGILNNRYKKLLEYFFEKEKKEDEVLQKVSEDYQKILSVHDKIKSTDNEAELNSLNKYLHHLKLTHSYRVKDYLKTCHTLEIKHIAWYLELKENVVQRMIYSGRQKLKHILKQKGWIK